MNQPKDRFPIEQVRCELEKLAEPSYRDFSSRLLPGCYNLLGVRLPHLRKMAAEIARGDWRDFLRQGDDRSFEETMLCGMVIGKAKMEPEEGFARIRAFLPRIRNWSVCDSFCAGLKWAAQYPQKTWELVEEQSREQAPYRQRFAAVMALNYFVTEKSLKKTLRLLASLTLPHPAVWMGAGWAYSVCYVKFPKETGDFLEKQVLKWEVLNKACRKIVESNRTKAEQKDWARRLCSQKRPEKGEGIL